jgi:VIT1/CCC1 family predicted Fe2+/Mn2+ transporter
MGFVFERTGSYAIGLLALAVVALLMVGYTKARLSRTPA